jgi:hypothetical protein
VLRLSQAVSFGYSPVSPPLAPIDQRIHAQSIELDILYPAGMIFTPLQLPVSPQQHAKSPFLGRTLTKLGGSDA